MIFGILGFVFGLSAIAQVSGLKERVAALEKKIEE